MPSPDVSKHFTSQIGSTPKNSLQILPFRSIHPSSLHPRCPRGFQGHCYSWNMFVDIKRKLKDNMRKLACTIKMTYNYLVEGCF